jgi:hypothetical protein
MVLFLHLVEYRLMELGEHQNQNYFLDQEVESIALTQGVLSVDGGGGVVPEKMQGIESFQVLHQHHCGQCKDLRHNLESIWKWTLYHDANSCAP